MNDPCTVDLGVTTYKTESSATGRWSQNSTVRLDHVLKKPSSGGFKALLLVLLSAPAIAVHDRWYEGCLQRDVFTVEHLFEEAIGQSVTRVEALSIVRRILKDAEDERFKLVALEATRGIQWSDEE